MGFNFFFAKMFVTICLLRWNKILFIYAKLCFLVLFWNTYTFIGSITVHNLQHVCQSLILPCFAKCGKDCLSIYTLKWYLLALILKKKQFSLIMNSYWGFLELEWSPVLTLKPYSWCSGLISLQWLYKANFLLVQDCVNTQISQGI